MRVHQEVYWRDPGETTWTFRTPGLPSDFGLPRRSIHLTEDRLVHPVDPTKRTASEPGIGVYKTTDRGATWARQDGGLPKARHSSRCARACTTIGSTRGRVLRHANGDVYASLDEGKSWDRIAQYLPT